MGRFSFGDPQRLDPTRSGASMLLYAAFILLPLGTACDEDPSFGSGAKHVPRTVHAASSTDPAPSPGATEQLRPGATPTGSSHAPGKGAADVTSPVNANAASDAEDEVDIADPEGEKPSVPTPAPVDPDSAPSPPGDLACELVAVPKTATLTDADPAPAVQFMIKTSDGADATIDGEAAPGGERILKVGASRAITATVSRGAESASCVLSFPVVDQRTHTCDGNAAAYAMLEAKAPNLIASLADLQNIEANRHYKLAADLDLTPGFVSPFLLNVVLDGDGHVLRNAQINEPDGNRRGIFTDVVCSWIKNLKVENADVTGYEQVGSLAGYADGSRFERIQLQGIKVRGAPQTSFGEWIYKRSGIGGLIGVIGTRIALVGIKATDVSVRDGATIGGLFGRVDPSDQDSVVAEFRELDVEAEVVSALGVAGGIGASARGGEFDHVRFTGLVSSSVHVAGLVAVIEAPAATIVRDAEVDATVRMPSAQFTGGYEAMGYGIAGMFSRMSGAASFSRAKVRGSIEAFATLAFGTGSMITAGGLVGFANVGLNEEVTISASQSAANITAPFSWGYPSGGVGGILGIAGAGSITTTSYSGTIEVVTTNSSGCHGVGGLIGAATASSAASGSGTFQINGSRSDGKIMSTCAYLGGLAGFGRLEIGSSSSSMQIQGDALTSTYAGGLVGESIGRIQEAFASGAVAGAEQVGGLVGRAYAPYLGEGIALADVYATGAVKGGRRVGGLVGVLEAKARIERAYAVGAVTAGSGGGGLVGFSVDGRPQTSVSYWSSSTSGQTQSDGGSGKSETKLREAATFDGWDFDEIWKSPHGAPPRLGFE